MARAKGKLFSGDGGRDGGMGAKVGRRRGRGVMGMVQGHIFNHVTKREAAWETGLCFSNPAGHFCSTLLRSSTLSQVGEARKRKKKSVGGYGAATSQLHPISMQTVTM